MSKIIFTPSVLKIYALIFLAGCVGFTIFNYEQLSGGEGWGLVGMVGLFVAGFALLAIDLVITNLFRNRTTANILGLMVSAIATALLIFGGFFS